MRSCGEGCNWIACCQVRTDEWWYFPQTLLVATVLNIFVLSLCVHTHLLVLLHLIIYTWMLSLKLFPIQYFAAMMFGLLYIHYAVPVYSIIMLDSSRRSSRWYMYQIKF
jgi:hypothetical protein